MTAQIVEIAGQRIAMLPAEEFERLLELAEDQADADAADAADRRRDEGEEYVPLEIVDRLLAGESPLKVWRQYRDLTQEDLARIIGKTVATVSRIESGKMGGTRSDWRRLADALNVSVDDILPVEQA
ncbi:MAG TPA: helix-turn-helix transcriptional regulator [Burkholderiales bacterium]|nr:helix-turn-helix transcriptional regulator [Burkholderiales bacterium]